MDQFMCGQPSHKTKERIQRSHDHPAACVAQTCGCDLKICMQPMRTPGSCTGDCGHQMLKMILTKTIEEEAGHDEIKRRRWWLPRQRIRMDELHKRT